MTMTEADAADLTSAFMTVARERARPVLYGSAEQAEEAFDRVLDLITERDAFKLTLGERYFMTLTSVLQYVVLGLRERGGNGLQNFPIEGIAELDPRTARCLVSAARAATAMWTGETRIAAGIVKEYMADDELRFPFAQALGYVLIESVDRSTQ